MEERIRNLSVGGDCYIGLGHGIGTTVTRTRSRFLVEIVRRGSFLYDKEFTTLSTIVKWYKEMLTK